jgi:hypothetical protein
MRNISTCLSNQVKIASQTRIKTSHNIFLKSDFGLATILSLKTIFCQNMAIKSKITQSPRAYAMRLRSPMKKLAGRIIASMRAYVGLQLVKTGPRESHIKIFFLFPVVRVEAEKISFDFLSNQSFEDIFFQISGKIVMIPSPIMSHPEKYAQKL